MAPKRTNKRFNVPGNRTAATYDLKNQEHFNEFKQAGFIPQEYNSYNELQNAFLTLVYQGVSDKDAAEALGVDYRNVIGKGLLAAELSSKGTPRGISARSLREDIKPDERAYLINKFGEDWFKDYERYRKLEWGDSKALKKDKEIIERFSGKPVEEFTSAKQEADVLRDRLAAAFGKGGRAGQVHRGHGVSAMEGASVGKANLMPESGPLNVGHGSDPRYDLNVMRNLNMSANDLQNYYDDQLAREGLTINPNRYAGNYVAADESLRELKQGTSIGNPQVTVPVEPTKVDPRSIEWRDRRMFEIQQQLTAEYERQGMTPGEAVLKARQRVEEASLKQSTLFDVAQSRGGPVTTVQKANPPARQIGTVVGEQQIDPFGRPKLDRSGEPKFETRPVYAPPSGVVRVPNSQSLGRTAAAIATREPVPTPNPAQPKQIRTEAELDRIFANAVKPAPAKPVSGNFVPKGPVSITPTAKERALAAERAGVRSRQIMARSSAPQPMPKPAVAPPKVGQPAILNGQAVMWSGGGWVKIPTPKAMKPTAKPKSATRSSSSGTRMPSSNQPATRSRGASPLNRGSAAFGGIERQTNEAIPDMLGTSPFTFRLAD